MRAPAGIPGEAHVARLLVRWATRGQGASGAAVTEVLQTAGADGATLAARLQEVLASEMSARPAEAPRLRRALGALAVLRALSTRSQIGREWDPLLRRQEVVAIAHGIATPAQPLAEVEATVLALRRAGLIVTRGTGDADLSWDAIGPCHFFFCRTDGLFQPWDPQADAKEICWRERQTRVVHSAALDATLRWGPRRFNSAVTYAQLQHWIRVPYRCAGSDPYVLPYAYLTEEGLRFAEK